MLWASRVADRKGCVEVPSHALARQSTRVTASRIEGFRRGLMNWYARSARRFPWRRGAASNYERILAEVVLQRTKADAAAGFLIGFVREYPSWRSLSKASRRKLEAELRPLGLWRRRASVLWRLSRELALRQGRFPRERAELETLPGVGQYVANAVELFAFGLPRPLLDAGMARVLERYFGPRALSDIRYDPYLQALARRLVEAPDPALVNWAVLDLAALVCRKIPSCHSCPVERGCRYATSARTLDMVSAGPTG